MGKLKVEDMNIKDLQKYLDHYRKRIKDEPENERYQKLFKKFATEINGRSTNSLQQIFPDDVGSKRKKQLKLEKKLEKNNSQKEEMREFNYKADIGKTAIGLNTEGVNFGVSESFHRWGACALDGVIVVLVLYAIGTYTNLIVVEPSVIEKMNLNDSLKNYGIASSIILVYHILFLKFLGATPGKLSFRLKVVPNGGEYESLSWIQSIFRPLTFIIFNATIGFIYYAIAFLSPKRRQLADYIVGTRVISYKTMNTELKKNYILFGALILLSIPAMLQTGLYLMLLYPIVMNYFA